ncbi:MAG: IPT/TIG domain-containing protein [Candidatus Nanopelagicales bacterium]
MSATELTATVPSVTRAQTVTVTVTNPDGGTNSLANAYWYLADPLVQSVAPSSGPTSGGTTITITGLGFEPDLRVLVGGAAASDVQYGSSTWLTAVVPAGSVGAVDVEVVDPDDESALLADGFTYTAEPTPTPTPTPSRPLRRPTPTPTPDADPHAFRPPRRRPQLRRQRRHPRRRHPHPPRPERPCRCRRRP